MQTHLTFRLFKSHLVTLSFLHIRCEMVAFLLPYWSRVQVTSKSESVKQV